MQDRVSLYPGRVKLIPVTGQENTYDMVRADEPTQKGDPLSKDTFLKDDTAVLFGLDATAVPDDALQKIKTLLNSANDRIDAVNVNVESKAKIETGSYVGAGAKTKKLAFKNTPKIVFINADNSQYNRRMWFIWGQTYAYSAGGEAFYTGLTYSGNSVTLSANNEERTMNFKNWKYGYIALC